MDNRIRIDAYKTGKLELLSSLDGIAKDSGTGFFENFSKSASVDLYRGYSGLEEQTKLYDMEVGYLTALENDPEFNDYMANEFGIVDFEDFRRKANLGLEGRYQSNESQRAALISFDGDYMAEVDKRIKLSENLKKATFEYVNNNRIDLIEQYGNEATIKKQIQEEYAKRKAAQEEVARNANARGVAGSFTGSIAAGMLDPINLALTVGTMGSGLTFSLGKSAAMKTASVIFSEAVFNGLTEVALNPIEKERYERVGDKFDRSLLGAFGEGFIVGGALAGALKGIGYSTKKVWNGAKHISGMTKQDFASLPTETKIKVINRFSNDLVENGEEAFEKWTGRKATKEESKQIEVLQDTAKESLEIKIDEAPKINVREYPKDFDFTQALKEELGEDNYDSLRAPVKEPKIKKYPILGFIKQGKGEKGGVTIGSELFHELESLGITNKTHPGIFRKNGKYTNVDQLSEAIIGRDIEEYITKTETGELSYDSVYKAIQDELTGSRKNLTQEEMMLMEDYEARVSNSEAINDMLIENDISINATDEEIYRALKDNPSQLNSNMYDDYLDNVNKSNRDSVQDYDYNDIMDNISGRIDDDTLFELNDDLILSDKDYEGAMSCRTLYNA